MLTPEQHQAVVDAWSDNIAQEAFGLCRENSLSPQQCAAVQANAIRFGVAFCGPPQHLVFTELGVDPLDLASDLEAGEFNQEIAAILGYV